MRGYGLRFGFEELRTPPPERLSGHRGTSFAHKKCPPPRTTKEPLANYCRVLEGTRILMSEVPLYKRQLKPERLSGHRGTSLTSKRPPLGPYSRTIPRVLWWS